MANAIFPFIDASIEDTKYTEQALKVPTEYAWDFKTDCPQLTDGKWETVTKNDAIKIWAMKALRTQRYRFLAYSPNFGHEFENLIGKGLTKNTILSQFKRYINDALMLNPYIKSISNLAIDVESEKITIGCTLITPYGEVNLNV
jgi:hypothetical protein